MITSTRATSASRVPDDHSIQVALRLPPLPGPPTPVAELVDASSRRSPAKSKSAICWGNKAYIQSNFRPISSRQVLFAYLCPTHQLSPALKILTHTGTRGLESKVCLLGGRPHKRNFLLSIYCRDTSMALARRRSEAVRDRVTPNTCDLDRKTLKTPDIRVPL